ncbi:MAG: cupin domain-containing protein [Candidatus Marinimicrobia bacterium]|nr:cupin domain-containing protein [Candidatus Neomarinimicrobiota bacterium]
MNYRKKSYNFENLDPWLNLLRDDLDLKGVAMGFARIPAGRGYTFIHQHEQQEEVYVVMGGKGIIYIDGEIIELVPGDIVKVDAIARRCLKADDDSELVCLILGALPAEGFPRKASSSTLIDDGIPDWENLPPWYEGNEKVIEINKKIRAQREAD